MKLQTALLQFLAIMFATVVAQAQSTAAFEGLDVALEPQGESGVPIGTGNSRAPAPASSADPRFQSPVATHSLGPRSTVVATFAPPALAKPARKEVNHWYGWQSLIADGASLAIGVSGGVMDLRATTPLSSALLYSSFVGYLLGAPAVHWGHEQIEKGFASIGLRVGLPLAGFFIPYAVGPRCFAGSEGDNGSLACLPYMVGGVIVGAVAAVAIDDAVLAYDTPAKGDHRAALSSRLSIAPYVTSNQRGLVLRGAF
jgi:hypothetical protein